MKFIVLIILSTILFTGCGKKEPEIVGCTNCTFTTPTPKPVPPPTFSKEHLLGNIITGGRTPDQLKHMLGEPLNVSVDDVLEIWKYDLVRTQDFIRSDSYLPDVSALKAEKVRTQVMAFWNTYEGGLRTLHVFKIYYLRDDEVWCYTLGQQGKISDELYK